MISKGSWVALATCSAESPIVSKRCAVSVLTSCLPSTLPSSILPGKVAETSYTIPKYAQIKHDQNNIKPL